MTVHHVHGLVVVGAQYVTLTVQITNTLRSSEASRRDSLHFYTSFFQWDEMNALFTYSTLNNHQSLEKNILKLGKGPEQSNPSSCLYQRRPCHFHPHPSWTSAKKDKLHLDRILWSKSKKENSYSYSKKEDLNEDINEWVNSEKQTF